MSAFVPTKPVYAPPGEGAAAIRARILGRRLDRCQPYRDEIRRVCGLCTRTDYQGVLACKDRLSALQIDIKRIDEGKEPTRPWTGNEALGVWLPKVYRP